MKPAKPQSLFALALPGALLSGHAEAIRQTIQSETADLSELCPGASALDPLIEHHLAVLLFQAIQERSSK